MKNKIFFCLAFIIIIASLLRLWDLGKVPLSADWDEVSLGYNAFSILQTGRDEYGEFLPLILRSFDDYKPALYSYFTIPSISIFGLNVISVRLPSVIFGILTVLATFFLVKELFKKNNIALLSSFLLAISPWHIQFSRVAFESNVGLALNVLGVLFFLKSFKYPKFLLLSALLIGLNLHMYQSEKAFVPLMIAIGIFIFRKQFFLIGKKYIITAFLIFAIISLPLINSTFSNQTVLSRAKGVSIFSNANIYESSVRKINRDKASNDVLGLFLDNRRVEFAKNIISGYISHFDLNWLFITGDFALNRHHAPRMGLMYIWELPFLLIGVYSILFGFLFNKLGKNEKLFFLSWILISPIPASITNGVPHAVRTLNFLPTPQVLVAIGIIASFAFLKNMKSFFKYIIFIILSIFIVFNFLYYINQYFVQQNYEYATDWQYGYKEMVGYVKPIQQKYKKIIVSDKHELSQSYIFFLFYLKYDPFLYLKEGGTIKDKNKFSNFEFRKLDYPKEEKNTLLIGTSGDFPENIKGIFEVRNPNGSVAIKGVEI